jgi:ribonuclease R
VQGVANTHSRPDALNPRPSAEPIAADELNDIAVESSQAERRAADAERELIEWKKMRFMEDKVGDDFPAIILSCTKYGFFVELEEMFIEGLVPLGSLVGDHYSFRDTDRSIVGARTGHVFSLGQKVHVLLDRIDRQQRRLQFALLPGTEPVANTGAQSVRSGKSEAKKAKAKEKKPSGKAKQRQRKRR